VADSSDISAGKPIASAFLEALKTNEDFTQRWKEVQAEVRKRTHRGE